MRKDLPYLGGPLPSAAVTVAVLVVILVTVLIAVLVLILVIVLILILIAHFLFLQVVLTAEPLS